MPKISWTKYIDTHKAGICAFTAVNNWKNKTPKNLAFNNKKWPSSYGMLTELLNSIFKGDWASTQLEKNNVIHIIMKDENDAKKLEKILPTRHNNKPNKLTCCTQNLAFTYQAEDYGKFAIALGYAPKPKDNR